MFQNKIIKIIIDKTN